MVMAPISFLKSALRLLAIKKVYNLLSAQSSNRISQEEMKKVNNTAAITQI